MSELLEKLLFERDYLIADGAIGTNLFNMGLETGEAPDIWNIDNPKNVLKLHGSFVEAGSDILTTNTFGANRYRLKLHSAEEKVHEINYAGIKIAREAGDAVTRPVVVAASIGPTGEIFEPVGSLSIGKGESAFAEQAEAQAEAGADVHWVETISSSEELTAAICGASRTGLPIVFTMTFDTVGHTMMGLTPEAVVDLGHNLRDQLRSVGNPGVIAYGSNCGVGPATLVDTILRLNAHSNSEDVLIAKGNCGIPNYEDGKIVYSGTPEVMADYARMARDAGARIIGGCCGTSAEHISAMVKALDNYTPGVRPDRVAIESKLGVVDTAPLMTASGNRRRRSRNRE